MLVFRRNDGRNSSVHWQQAAIVSILVLFALLHFAVRRVLVDGSLSTSRNFFGVLNVRPEVWRHFDSLYHGTTLHGSQSTLPVYRMLPTTYYTQASGIGLTLQAHGNVGDDISHQARIGVVGLGVGTLATRGGNYMRFYEINPAVVALFVGEHPQFTFLRDAAGAVDVVLGDARLELEAAAAHGAYGRFDIWYWMRFPTIPSRCTGYRRRPCRLILGVSVAPIR